MNEKYITEATDRIDTKYIDEALTYRRPRINVKAVAAVAAALALVLGAGAYYYAHNSDAADKIKTGEEGIYAGGEKGDLTGIYDFSKTDNDGEEHSATSVAENDTSEGEQVASSDAMGDRFVYYDAGDIIEKCPLIVIGEYQGDVGEKTGLSYPVTYGQLKIEQVLKGECPEEITLRLEYYRDGNGDSDQYVCPAAIAPMKKGTRAIFCLKQWAGDEYYIDGAYSGLYGLDGDGSQLLSEPGWYNEMIGEKIKDYYSVNTDVPEIPTGVYWEK